MRVEIFSEPNCAFCAQAKALLDEAGLAYVEHDISDPRVREAFARRLLRVRVTPASAGHATVWRR